MPTILRLTQKWTESYLLPLLILLMGCATDRSSAQQPPLVRSPHKTISEVVQDLAWTRLPEASESSPVQIWSIGERGNATFVVTHGMGGTQSGDRFHQLAAAIHKQFPRACVVRIDWSERASAKANGLPNPWKVAASIDEIATIAAKDLVSVGIDPNRSTFIGESFGNWVNARIARELGGVQGILAVNPANEAGGYRPPDLRKVAKRSWAIHTYSVFDTTLEIAENDCWLATPAAKTDWDRHVSGIDWLTSRLDAGDSSWLQLDKPLPKRRPGYFQAMITPEGALSDEQLSRKRPASPSTANRSETLVASSQKAITP